MDLAEFDYQLPEELIAQEALADRAAARMLVVYRQEERWEDRAFREFPSFLREGDCLLLNDSRVFPARLFGRRAGVQSQPIGKNNPKRHEYLSGQVEVFLLRPVSADGRDWEALVRPGRKMRVGELVAFDGGLEAEIVARGAFGERTVRFHASGDLFEQFEKIGHVPLPPYIKRSYANRSDEATDRERYQTVFAREPKFLREGGSVAAPTAGLHFTPEILEACREAGAVIARVTLHVGLGTFQPLRTEVLEDIRLHAERFVVPPESVRAMDAAWRVVAVGTTSVRAIESDPGSSETSIFIRPGFRFRRTGAMLTNFHLPKSSLLLLVCAFAGKDLTLAAYRHAVEQRYRFFSYGDCMLIL
jgi:S-adenosylmethionine:tRNA ribosyltransferase-isomerase